MNVVIYARFSSHGQREQSIEGQLQICHDFAKANGYIVIGEYIDRAKTGTTDNRTSFQQMIADSDRPLSSSTSLNASPGTDMTAQSIRRN